MKYLIALYRTHMQYRYIGDFCHALLGYITVVVVVVNA